MPKYNQNKGLSSIRYFSWVGLVTLILAGVWLFNEPVLRYQTEVALGLKSPIELKKDAFYQHRIQAVLTKYCAACHDARKAKGDLRIDNYLHTRYSGKSGHNIIPFSSAASEMIARIELPENDKRLMPPLGWDKPTEDELNLLKMWIDKGASASLTQADFPNAPAPVVEVSIPTIDYQAVKQARKPVKQALMSVTSNFPHAFNFIARNSHLLRFSTVSLTTPLNDQAFATLNTISPYISSLYLWDTQLTDKSKTVLLNMHQLQEAYLQGVNISEQTLMQLIQQNKQLSKLSLHPQLVTPQIKQLCLTRNIILKEVKHV